MKYYKNAAGSFFAFEEDGSQDHLITSDMVSVTIEDVNYKTPEQIEAEAKAATLLALSQITVTTAAGNTFDGDDTARESMLSAIQASGFLGLTDSNWKLADNTWKVIGITELQEAHALAIQAKGAILGT